MDVGKQVINSGPGERHAIEPGVEPDDLANREIGLEARRLELYAHSGFRGGRICSSVDIADPDRAGVGLHQALDRAERAGLPRAVWPQQTKDLAFVNVERDTVDGHLRAVPDAETFDLKSQVMRHGLVAGGRHSGSHNYGQSRDAVLSRGLAVWKSILIVKAAAADRPERVRAVVSRGGRPDLAGPVLPRVRQPTLLIVGGEDDVVMDLNRLALRELGGIKQLVIIPGATHLFEEPGALEQVAALAREWFLRYLEEKT